MFFICMTSTNSTNSNNTDNKVLDNYISRIAQGDSEAMSALYYQTQNSIYGFALSILKNTDDAQDVLQDCFIKIHSAAAAYVSQGKPLAWMLTITKNLCYLKIRNNKRDDHVPMEALETYFADNSSVTSEDKVVLYQCLNNLTDEERQIVILHTVAGLKHREISKLLELPLSTVLSKYNRSLKKLKIMLKESY